MGEGWEKRRLWWKRMFYLILNAEPSRLLEVLPEENLEKHGMR